MKCLRKFKFKARQLISVRIEQTKNQYPLSNIENLQQKAPPKFHCSCQPPSTSAPRRYSHWKSQSTSHVNSTVNSRPSSSWGVPFAIPGPLNWFRHWVNTPGSDGPRTTSIKHWLCVWSWRHHLATFALKFSGWTSQHPLHTHKRWIACGRVSSPVCVPRANSFWSNKLWDFFFVFWTCWGTFKKWTSRHRCS